MKTLNKMMSGSRIIVSILMKLVLFVSASYGQLTINVSGIDAACPGQCDGQATVSVDAGAVFPISVLWSDPMAQTTYTASGLCAGTYSVTVSDFSGATATDQVTIGDLGAGWTDFQVSDDTICDGDIIFISTTLTGIDTNILVEWVIDGVTEYSSSGFPFVPSLSTNISGAGTKEICLRLTHPVCGLLETCDTIVVLGLPIIEVNTFYSEPFCWGDTAMLVATSTGTGFIWQYRGLDSIYADADFDTLGMVNDTIYVTEPGQYIVSTYSADSCAAFDVATVLPQNCDSCNFTSSLTFDQNNYCLGDSGEINIFSDALEGSSLLYTSAPGLPFIAIGKSPYGLPVDTTFGIYIDTSLTSGWYHYCHISFTDSCYQIACDSVYIDTICCPTANFTFDDTLLCVEQDHLLQYIPSGPSVDSIQWLVTGIDVLYSGPPQDINVNPPFSGQFEICLVVFDATCGNDTLCQTFDVFDALTVDHLSYSVDSPFCIGDTITITASPGFDSYEWSVITIDSLLNGVLDSVSFAPVSAGFSNTITVTEAGFYQVTVFDNDSICPGELVVPIFPDFDCDTCSITNYLNLSTSTFCYGDTIDLSYGMTNSEWGVLTVFVDGVLVDVSDAGNDIGSYPVYIPEDPLEFPFNEIEFCLLSYTDSCYQLVCQTLTLNCDTTPNPCPQNVFPDFDVTIINGYTVSVSDLTNGGNPDYVTWDFGDGSSGVIGVPNSQASHTYSGPGTYTICLTVADIQQPSNFCCYYDTCITITLSTDTCDLVNFRAIMNVVFDPMLPKGTVTFQDISYPQTTVSMWDFGDGNTDMGQTVTHNYLAAGYYNVCLVSIFHIDQANNICCIDTTCTTIYACPDSVSLPENPDIGNPEREFTSLENQFGSPEIGMNVYPNPFDGKLVVSASIPEGENGVINLYDVMGRVMWFQDISNDRTGDNRIEVFNTEKLPAGIYFVELRSENRQIVKRVTKR